MASSVPLTTRLARTLLASSPRRCSSNSALARMTPSWLLSPWRSLDTSDRLISFVGRPEGAASGATAELGKFMGRFHGGFTIGIPPQRVLENPYGPARGSDVLDLAAG